MEMEKKKNELRENLQEEEEKWEEKTRKIIYYFLGKKLFIV